MGLQKTVFGKSKRKANLIFGGFASTYNTPSQILTLFGQYSGATPIVWTVGNDTHVILNSFVLLNNIIGNNNLTYIIETTNMTTSCPVIRSCPNLVFVEYWQGKTMGGIQDCVNINYSLCKLPLVNSLTTYHNTFYGAFANSPGVGTTLSLPSVLGLGQQMNFVECKCTLEMPNLTSASTYRALAYFKGTLNAKKLTNLGSPSANDSIFEGVNSQTILNVNTALSTCNAGSPDADIVFAISRAATVNYFP